MFSTSKDNGSCFQDAIKVSSSILRVTGGRIYVVQGNPSIITEKAFCIKGPTNTTDKKLCLMPTGPSMMEMTADMH
jgi:hypothetical protein